MRTIFWVSSMVLATSACVGSGGGAPAALPTTDTATADLTAGSDAAAETATAKDTSTSADAAPGQDAGADTAKPSDIAVVVDAPSADTVAPDATKPPIDGPAPIDAPPPPDASPPDSGTAPPIGCSGPVYYFPAFDKTCKADADCFVALHTINCCGSMVALGYNTKDKDAFAAAEMVCDNQYPGCGCASFGTEAEDGYSDGTGSNIVAKCVAGQCTTSVPTGKMECGTQGLMAPKPFKFCNNVSECDTVTRLADCCGSKIVVGITKGAKANFAGMESKCSSSMPMCDCLSKPTTAEDGGVIGDAPPGLKCSYGACFTSAK